MGQFVNNDGNFHREKKQNTGNVPHPLRRLTLKEGLRIEKLSENVLQKDYNFVWYTLIDRTHVPNLHIIMRRADWDR
jgi:hypothetical protein